MQAALTTSRMLRPQIAKAIIALGSVLVLACWVFLGRNIPIQDVMVGLSGFTNDFCLGRLALVSITNRLNRTVVCGVSSVESLHEGAWTSAPNVSNSPATVVLSPSQKHTWLISPSNDVPWRIHVICLEDSMDMSALIRRLDAFVEWIRSGVGLGTGRIVPTINGRRYTVVGPIIDP